MVLLCESIDEWHTLLKEIIFSKNLLNVLCWWRFVWLFLTTKKSTFDLDNQGWTKRVKSIETCFSCHTCTHNLTVTKIKMNKDRVIHHVTIVSLTYSLIVNSINQIASVTSVAILLIYYWWHWFLYKCLNLASDTVRVAYGNTLSSVI